MGRHKKSAGNPGEERAVPRRTGKKAAKGKEVAPGAGTGDEKKPVANDAKTPDIDNALVLVTFPVWLIVVLCLIHRAFIVDMCSSRSFTDKENVSPILWVSGVAAGFILMVGRKMAKRQEYYYIVTGIIVFAQIFSLAVPHLMCVDFYEWAGGALTVLLDTANTFRDAASFVINPFQ